jgi:prepilin-type N-terminal cleavage/methylation domain-containing protein/prepilin-type processing-associated H-X9-DG protein
MPRQQIFRRGFTIVELLIVIVIIAVLVGLLLPSVQSVRTTTRRSECSFNLRNLLLAVHSYEASHGCFPPAGHGIDEASLVNARQNNGLPREAFDHVSVFARLIPYTEVAIQTRKDDYDYSRAYNDPSAAQSNSSSSETGNSFTAKQQPRDFRCASNPFFSAIDSAGYGMVDYMPVSYTDIDPKPDARGIVGLRNRHTTAIGAFSMRGSRQSDFYNGLSKTIAMVESAGRIPESRPPAMCGEFDDPICLNATGANDSCTKTARRAFWRWAEPASAGGISGQRNHGANGIAVPFVPKISKPVFGDSKAELDAASCLSPPPEGTDIRCLWTWTNCGPNDEIFAFHIGGANAGYADGSVHFLKTNIDPIVLRHLLSRDERIPVAIDLPK